jgi:hypothetical protein
MLLEILMKNHFEGEILAFNRKLFLILYIFQFSLVNEKKFTRIVLSCN